MALRDYFHVWSRCGGSAFWEQVYPQRAGMLGLWIDPIDAVMLYAQEHPYVGGPAVQIVRSEAPDGEDPAWGPAADTLPRHMHEVYDDFQAGLFLASVFGWEKEQMLRWFLSFYYSQGEAYERGKERADDFHEPAREEVLTAVKKVLGALGGAKRTERIVVLKEDLEEALLNMGLVEC